MSRILLVEDEFVIRTELRRLLARHGHDVVEAGSIAEAEAAHDLCAFDLVLADVRLPGAPGTELVGRCGGAPVVLMTSYATVKAAVDAVKRGAADYLSKPFDHAELVALVEHHLAGARSGQSAPAESAPRPSSPAPLLGLDDAPQPPAPAPAPAAHDGEPPSDSLESYFRRFVLEHQHELTETEIARRLGISRKALWERRQRLGIPRPRS